MSWCSIEIDPNVRTPANETYSGFEDVTGSFPSVGDWVTVTESESGIEGDATVSRINHDRHLIYLYVDWSSLRDKESSHVPTEG